MADTDFRPGRARIRDATIQRLRQAIPALANSVYSARVWPLQTQDQPALLVYMAEENKRGFGPAGRPSFTVTAQLAIHARVAGPDEITVEAQLDAAAGQIETALLCDAAWVTQFEQISGVTTQIQLKPEAERAQGEALLIFGLQWSEAFDPVIADTLTGVRLTIDTRRPFDAAGTYQRLAGFPAAAPAPRAAGPDGRVEIAATIALP